MNKLPLDNSYALLMVFLAPQKTEARLLQIQQAAENNQIVWEELLYQANIQLCTPLWFSQLRKDGLLELLPSDLVEYISEIYNANEERNIQMRLALIELLSALNAASIDSILLKGASTFCDNLYGDLGSRVMGDLDVLVPADKVEQSQLILDKLGYVAIPNKGMELEGLPTDVRHHQLLQHYIPNTPVVVEIHFKLSYAMVGRMLPVETAWKNRVTVCLQTEATSVLSPSDKLILNTGHALVPHREYIRGYISLLQLTEFTNLTVRYGDEISKREWLAVAAKFGLSVAFATYAMLSSRYMDGDFVRSEGSLTFNEKRILFLGRYLEKVGIGATPLVLRGRNLFYQGLYLLKLPFWVWINPCYVEGWKNLPARLRLLFVKLLSFKSWGKV
ncbi:MAG: hypothetical protein COB22_02385 [Cycloclasticus sp.]|nr:MAG: hypothetical protein COB22_02385 [Cycloclasticus sp.]